MSKERFTFDTTNLIFNDNIKGDWLDDIEVCELLNQQDQRIAELEEKVDYVFKINTWLIKKYGKEFREDVGINEDDNTITNFIKLYEIFDKIYEEINKEMPKKWYEYGFFGLPKLDKGE